MLPYSSSEVPAHSPKRCMYLIGLPPIGQPAEETFFFYSGNAGQTCRISNDYTLRSNANA